MDFNSFNSPNSSKTEIDMGIFSCLSDPDLTHDASEISACVDE